MIELSSQEIMANLDLRHVSPYFIPNHIRSHVCFLLPLVSDMSEKERFLTSVINALAKDEFLAVSSCMAQALILRAQVYSNNDLDNARADAIRAAALDPHHPTVWRVLATIEEERNDPAAAIQALSNWAMYQPHFSTKVQNEISRLRNGAIST
jgi:hypothetical protein